MLVSSAAIERHPCPEEPLEVMISQSLQGSSSLIWLSQLDGYESYDAAFNLHLRTGVATDAEGNVYFSGGTPTNEGVFAKFDPYGRLVWRTPEDAHLPPLYDIVVDMTGNIYVAGPLQLPDYSDIYIAKYSPGYAQLWNTTIPNPCYMLPTGAYALALDNDGSIYIAGTVYDLDGEDVALAKVNPSGELMWNVTWDSGSYYDRGVGIASDNRGYVYVVGGCPLLEGLPGRNGFLLKFDANGSLVWEVGCSDELFDRAAYAVAVDKDNGVFVVGREVVAGGSSMEYLISDAFVRKYTENGSLLWHRSWGDFNSQTARGVAILEGGGVFVTGDTWVVGPDTLTLYADPFLIEYDNNGTLVDAQLLSRYSLGYWADDYGQCVATHGNHTIYVSGLRRSVISPGMGRADGILLKYDTAAPDLSISPDDIRLTTEYVSWDGKIEATVRNEGMSNATASLLTCEFVVDAETVGVASLHNVNIPPQGSIDVSSTWRQSKLVGSHTINVSVSIDVPIEDVDSGDKNNFASKCVTVTIGALDTDEDGMADDWEYYNGLNMWSAADADDDPDRDHLTNLAEARNGTDPWNPDTDGDGVPDGWEIDYGFNPLLMDSVLDADMDGLSSQLEFGEGTSPRNGDTDADGLPDGWEVAYSLDPLNSSDALLDLDTPTGDGVTNLDEYTYGTNPLLADTDGDFLDDGFELLFSKTNPTYWDTDGDGIGDSIEGYSGKVQMLAPGWIGMTISWSNYTISIATNSSVLQGSFDQDTRTLSLKIRGLEGTSGVTDLRVPRDLCNLSDIQILLDDVSQAWNATVSGNEYLIHVEYSHSIHDLLVKLAGAPIREEKGDSPLGGVVVVIGAISAALAVVILATRLRRTKGRRDRTHDDKEESK